MIKHQRRGFVSRERGKALIVSPRTSGAEYREEQHLPKVKWAAFREQRRHEDTAVARFERKQHAAAHETREVDARHDAFLRRLRRCLDRKVRESGGTEFSVLRASFLDWDADCSGAIDAGELRKARTPVLKKK